jgi:hypothetical protein
MIMWKTLRTSAGLLLLVATGAAHAALEHYATWNGWGELTTDDKAPFFGAHHRANDDTNWEVALWNAGHNAAASSNFSWTDRATYAFDYHYDKSTGAVSYSLDSDDDTTPELTLTANIAPGLVFNTFYVYVKNLWQNVLTIDEVTVNGTALGTLPGFDGTLQTGVLDNSTQINHQTAKFIDPEPNGSLTNGLHVTGRFYLDNSSVPGVTKEQMQVSIKAMWLEGVTQVPVPPTAWLIGLGAVAGFAAASRRKHAPGGPAWPAPPQDPAVQPSAPCAA